MLEATKAAVRSMIEYLGVEHGLNRVEAYMLCSVAADLRLHEVVRSNPPRPPRSSSTSPRIIIGGYAQLRCTLH